MRRGQTEGIGIAIIVMIVIIAAVVFLSNVRAPEFDPREESDRILRDTFAYVLLQSHVFYAGAEHPECRRTLLSMLQNYGPTGIELTCAGNTYELNASVENHIDFVRTQMLDRWRRNYHLVINVAGESAVDASDCDDRDIEGVTTYENIGAVTVEFALC